MNDAEVARLLQRYEEVRAEFQRRRPNFTGCWDFVNPLTVAADDLHTALRSALTPPNTTSVQEVIGCIVEGMSDLTLGRISCCTDQACEKHSSYEHREIVRASLFAWYESSGAKLDARVALTPPPGGPSEATELLRWLVNLHHDVSKNGEKPTDAEWTDALEQSKTYLAGMVAPHPEPGRDA